MRIGFFDSGIGGLTVLADAVIYYKDCEFVYCGDGKHAPYGTKSADEVLALTLDAAKTLANENLDALVVACNTATSVSVRVLRDLYDFPVIGMEPALKPAVTGSEGKVLVLATDLTLKQAKFNYLVETFNAQDRVLKLPMGQLVNFAEKGDFNSDELISYIKERFSTIDFSEIDSVVLGCTHFLYFKSILQKLLPPNIKIYDGNMGTIKHTAKLAGIELLDTPQEIDYSKITFYYSDVLLDKHCAKLYKFKDSINNYLEEKNNV